MVWFCPHSELDGLAKCRPKRPRLVEEGHLPVIFSFFAFILQTHSGKSQRHDKVVRNWGP